MWVCVCLSVCVGCCIQMCSPVVFEKVPPCLSSLDKQSHASSHAAWTRRKNLTLSTPMAFMESRTPSRGVSRISGGECCGKVSLNTAEENNLQTTHPALWPFRCIINSRLLINMMGTTLTTLIVLLTTTWPATLTTNSNDDHAILLQ